MFIDAVESAGVNVSMDGRGRWLDNRFIKRLWRSVQYEDIYLQDDGGGLDAGRGLGCWFDRYNQERPHQALGYATPAAVYSDPGAHGAKPAKWRKSWWVMRFAPSEFRGPVNGLLALEYAHDRLFWWFVGPCGAKLFKQAALSLTSHFPGKFCWESLVLNFEVRYIGTGSEMGC